MKIIHLSDLHIGDGDCTQAFQRIVDFLNADSAFADGENAVVITGDFIEDAGDDSPFVAFKSILAQLSPRFENRIFLCPGNHDYGDFWGGHEDFIDAFRQEFPEYLTGSGHIPLKEYQPADMPYPSPYPVVDIIGETVLIGIDSTADELEGERYEFGAQGSIGQWQRTALNNLLNHPQVDGKKVVVYLHHHPYRYLHFLNLLKDAEEFVEVVKDRVHVLLFGHNHYYQDCSHLSDDDGIPLALEGGKSTEIGRFRVVQDLDGFCYEEYLV